MTTPQAGTSAADPASTTNGTASHPSAANSTASSAPANGATGNSPASNTDPIRDPQAKDAADSEARYRRELREAQAKVAELEAEKTAQAQAAEIAKLGELEAANKKLELEQQKSAALRSTVASLSVQLLAKDLGIVDAEVAATLIAPSLDLASDGTPKNAEALLKDLLKAKPYLKAPEASAPAKPTANNNGPANPTGGGNPSQVAQAANRPAGFDFKNAPRLADIQWKKE